MRLLLVEDDTKIAAFIVRGLTEEGYAVEHATDGAAGLQLAVEGNPDAAIIDLMLPQMDGLSLIRELRRSQRQTPVMVLSARREIEERVRCLQAGSDDYLVKPFAFSELLARVQALLRRATNALPAAAQGHGTKLVVGDLELDYVKRAVVRGGRKIDLQPREFSLLEYLMRNAWRPVSKTLILEEVWDYHFDPQTNVVDVLVCRLRGKLDCDSETPLLHTLRGVGYLLKSA